MTTEEMDKKIEYFYRNNFTRQHMAEELGVSVSKVAYRLQVIRKRKELKRWWEE